MKRTSFVSGYTLVEVLVGMLIVTFMFIGGYTAYREFIRRQALDSTAETLKTNLTLARQKAISSEKPFPCSSDTLVGYEVSFTNNSYTVSPDCLTINPGYSYDSTYNLPATITLSISNFTSPLLYKSVSGTNLSVNGTITLTHSAGGSKVVTITPQGIVQ